MKKLLLLLFAVLTLTACGDSPIKSYITKTYPTATNIEIMEDSAYNAHFDITRLNRECSEVIEKLVDMSKQERRSAIDSLEVATVAIQVHLEDVFNTPRINSKAYKVNLTLNGLPKQIIVFEHPLGNMYFTDEQIETEFNNLLDKIEDMNNKEPQLILIGRLGFVVYFLLI